MTGMSRGADQAASQVRSAHSSKTQIVPRELADSFATH